MTYKAYSEEQKTEILNVVCNEIENSLTPISEICKTQNVSFRTLQRWCVNNNACSSMLDDATMQRAWRYSEEAINIIDNASTYFEDKKGNRRDSNASVNKAKYQAEFRLKLAETLAPDTFGNLKHEIKAIQKEIEGLKKIVANNNKQRNFLK